MSDSLFQIFGIGFASVALLLLGAMVAMVWYLVLDLWRDRK